MEGWSDEELAGAVDAYQVMLQSEAIRRPYNKRQIYRELSNRFGRTDKAFEYRMQNISAVLSELGKPWVSGLKPAGNVGENVKQRIVELLARPASGVVRLRDTEPEYKEKLPAIRLWLMEVARAEGVVTYGEVMAAFGIGHRNLRRVMDYIGHQSDNLDEPIITALIVNPKTGRCSAGFAKEFGVSDDIAERDKLYAFWRNEAGDEGEIKITGNATLEVRAARFVCVEARPSQAAFRRQVFLACDGACVISGCDIVQALDAAHKHGRDWRKGCNRAEDGYLLRKDLHALYDKNLLRISNQGIVELAPALINHYADINGVKIKVVQTFLWVI